MSYGDDQPLFLGLDLSTQGLKAVLITEESEVVHESAVNFDRELPHYATTNGAIRGPDEGEVTSPVRMWLEAVDLIVSKMKAAGVNLGRIMAISGDGQVCSFRLHAYLLHPLIHCLSSHSNTVPFTGPLKPNNFFRLSTHTRASPTSSRPPPSPSSALPSGKIRPPPRIAASSKMLSEALRSLQTLPAVVPMNGSPGTRSAE
jgi:hypothetical protein